MTSLTTKDIVETLRIIRHSTRPSPIPMVLAVVIGGGGVRYMTARQANNFMNGLWVVCSTSPTGHLVFYRKYIRDEIPKLADTQRLLDKLLGTVVQS